MRRSKTTAAAGAILVALAAAWFVTARRADVVAPRPAAPRPAEAVSRPRDLPPPSAVIPAGTPGATAVAAAAPATLPASAAESAAPPPPVYRGLGPGEAAGRAFPPADRDALAARLAPERQAAWTAVREAFPETDLTDVQARHRALLARRARYGPELTDAERAEHAAWTEEIENLSRELVEARAAELGLARGGVEPDGRGFWLEGFERQRPRYTWTLNAAAAVSTGVHLVRLNAAFDPAVGGTIAGDGLYVNVNDHGTVYDENPEFQLPSAGGTRIVYKEVYDLGNRAHATHVTGTVGAWGYTAALMGMTPRVWIRSHIQQSTSDISGQGMSAPGQFHTTTNPRTGEPELKSVVGTTSLGNPDTNELRGIYTDLSASFDSTLRDYAYYTHFYAAGNNGTTSDDTAFYTIHTDTQVAKNLLTIGSVNDATRNAAGELTGGGALASTSSRGPVYDGRIKPDLVANGVALTSPSSATGSSAMTGTSMASPNAAGSAALLVDYLRRRLPGHYVRSSTIRALLVNTADDRGLAGPDYSYGWGLVNVHRAAGLVKRHAEQPGARVVAEELLASGATWSAVYRYDGAGPVRVTIAWLDPPGAAQTQSTATRDPRLVHDLDLRLVGPGGETYRPYVMPFVTGNATLAPFDHALRLAPAETGVNTTDNVEQVYIAAPPAGDYTIEIGHAGTLGGEGQRFSLAVSGLAQPGPLDFAAASVSPAVGDGTDRFALTVDGAGFALGSDVILRRTGAADAAAYEHVVLGDRIACRIDTAALEKGYWDVVVRAPDGSESILPDAFLLPVSGAREVVYANDFESGADGLTLGVGWEVAVPNEGTVGGPAAAAQGERVLVTYPDGNYPGGANASATLPAFSTAGRSDIRIEFQRWIGVRNNDYAHLEYSLNGTTWARVNRATSLVESDWSPRAYTLPSDANGRDAVYVRFRLQTSTNNHSFGWNVDDLRITALRDVVYPPAFASTPVPSAAGGVPYAYVAAATDPDTPPADLVFSATGLPPGLSVTNHGDGTATIGGAPAAAGVYPVRVTVTDGAYQAHQLYTLTVVRSTAAVTLVNLARVYNGAPQAAEVVTEPAGLTVVVTYDDAPGAPSAAGACRVHAAVTDPAYEGEAEDTMTVAPAPLALQADPQTKTIGDPDPALTWKVAGGELFAGDAVAGAAARDPGEVSGIYAIRRGTLDAGPNYELSFVDGELRILTAQGFLDVNANDIDDAWEDRYYPDGNLPATVVKRGIEMTLLEVFTANLDPHDASSFFMITAQTDDGKFTFTTATDRLYTVFWTDNLKDPDSWRALAGWTDVPGTGAPMEATAPAGPAVYVRVRVRLP